jgi:hypothetical protein
VRRIPLAALALVLAASVGACGDDDDDDGGATTGETSPAAGQFARQADAVCARVSGQIEELFETGQFPVVPSQVVEFVGRAAPLVASGMGELGALDAADSAEARSFQEEARAVGERWQEAATDPGKAQAVFDDEGGFEELREKGEAIGAKACERFDEEGEDAGGDLVDPATLSAEKRAYVEKVDAICTTFSERDSEVEGEAFGEGFPPTVEKWAAGLPRFAENGRQRLAAIREVAPPAADAAEVQSLLTAGDELVVDIDEAGRAAGRGDEAALVPLLQQLFPAFDEYDERLRSFGFQVCGSEDSEDEDEEEGEE